MKAFVFTDEALSRQAGRFVWLEIDSEKAVNAPLRNRFAIRAFPTFFVVDPRDTSVVLRWVGAATAAQLNVMLDEAHDRSTGVAAAKNTPLSGPEASLAAADRAYGAGDYETAAAAYRAALATAPANWPPYSRTIESTLFALQMIDSCEAAAVLAAETYPRLRSTPSAANVAVSGLSCALELDSTSAVRRDLLPGLEAAAREVAVGSYGPAALAAAEAGVTTASADDISSVLATLIEARRAAGDEPGRLAAAREWAAFLEWHAAEAKTPEQRTVFDSHRLGAYLELNEPERAIPMLEQSARDFPDDYNPHSRLAVTYKAMKRWDDALAASGRALERAYGPRKLGMLGTRADILTAKGDLDGARTVLDEAIRTAEALPDGQRSEGTIASLKKRREAMAGG